MKTLEKQIREDLENNIVNNLTVNELAWAYKVNYTSITPIIRKLVKERLLYVKAISGVGNNIYATC